MKLLLSWANEFVNISKIPPKELAEKLVHIGFEIEEIIEVGKDIELVKTGKILEIKQHPNADKLAVCSVGVGENLPIQIVTGAKNISVGDIVPVALVGASLACGLKISKGNLRGEISCGMLCSGEELGINDDWIKGASENGILILPKNTKVGEDIKKVLGLNEVIFDISILANRPDCNSVYGMCREIAASLNKPLKPLDLEYNEVRAKRETEKACKVEVKDFTKCSRYMGRAIEDIKIKPSTALIQKRLKLLGLKPINNIVDITNYVLLEVGQPLHAFDLEKLDSHIIVREAKEGEKIRLLNGNDYSLSESDLVIADSEKALALAGVMGGEGTAVSKKTASIFLESARFSRGRIRHTSRSLKVKSDSSIRFERGVDFSSVEVGINRALSLICKSGAGKVTNIKADSFFSRPKQTQIKTSAEQIAKVLGITIPAKKIVDILKRLEFSVVESESGLRITAPLFREDIENYPCIAEEVIRFFGYDKIVGEKMVSLEVSQGGFAATERQLQKIKSQLAANGFFETVTYSFVSEKIFDKLLLEKNDTRRAAVKLLNPLGEDFSILRPLIFPSLLNVAKLNLARKNQDFRLFEIAKTFVVSAEPNTLPKEKETLALVTVGGSDDFYSVKNTVLRILNTDKYNIEYANEPFLHPGLSAKITIRGGEQFATFGKIHPIVAKNFDIPESVFVAEIALDSIIQSKMSDKAFVSLPKFPSVSRDIAVVVGKEILVGDIIKSIRAVDKKLIEDVKLFDVYEGEQVMEGQKSVAIALTLRSEDKTLTDNEIQLVLAQVLNVLEAKFNAKLR